MSNFNRVIFLGRLTRPVELRHSQGGTAIAKFGMASSRVTGSGPDRKEKPCFIDVVAFGKTAETLDKYMEKGNLLHIEGRLEFSQWEDKNGGGKRSKLEVVCESFQFMPGNKDGSEEKTAAPESAPF